MQILHSMSSLKAQHADFVRAWRPPRSPSEFESKIEAIASLTPLSSLQVQFVADFWQYNNGRAIGDDLLDECDKYTKQQLSFVENLSIPENSQGAQASPSSQDPIPSASNSIIQNPPPVIPPVSNPNIQNIPSVIPPVSNANIQNPLPVIPPVSNANIQNPPPVNPPVIDRQDSGNFEEDEVADGLVAAGPEDVIDGASLSCVASGGQKSSTFKTLDKAKDSGIDYSSLESCDIAPDSEVEPHNDSHSHVNRSSENVINDIPNLEKSKISRMSDKEKEIYFVQNSLMALQKEHELLDKARKCTDCKVNVRDITFLPCGHFLMCKNCSEPVYECPLCFKDVLATAQTYLS